MRSILIAEDDPHITSFVRRGLRAAGYETAEAADGHTALLMARSGTFDLVLLDIGLGGMDGFDVLANLRGEGVATPVIILTARDSVIDTVRGLESGANDYVTKPFSFAILVARLRALVRRGAVARPAILEAGDLRLDPAAHRVWRGETPVSLTAREFSVLEYLMRHRGQVLSKRALIDGVWDDDFDGDPNIVEVYVGHLRRKLDKPFGREALETIRGAGYRLAANGG